MKLFLTLAAAAMPVQAFAQPTPPAPVQAIDAGRLALAQTTVDYIWPLGTYARMMSGSMEPMSEGLMAATLDMKPGDMAGGEAGKAADRQTGGKTLRQLMAENDPHFSERLRIMNRVMMTEMAPAFTRIEPEVRRGLASAFARKFDESQLTEMNRFFATPAGGAYARESVLMWADPEFVGTMARAMPDIFKDMPRIMKAVEAATAHLPKPPASKRKKR